MITLVAGAFGAIGFSICQALAQRGDSLVLLDRGLPEGQDPDQVSKDLVGLGATGVAHHSVDFRDPRALEECLTELSQSVSIDVVINAAGIQRVASINDQTLDVWLDVLHVNLTASFLTIKHFLPGMCQRGFGRVVNIASVHGLVASSNKAPYVSSKHGLIGLTKVAALEAASLGNSRSGGVTVNAVCPGWVDTPLLDQQVFMIQERDECTRDEALLRLLDLKQPSRRLTTRDELAKLVLFLTEPYCHNITGTAIPVDGGWSIQ